MCFFFVPHGFLVHRKFARGLSSSVAGKPETRKPVRVIPSRPEEAILANPLASSIFADDVS